MSKIKGNVKWFNESSSVSLLRKMAAKMYSYTSLQSSQRFQETLAEGQRVEFEITNGAKGPSAANVIAL